MNPKDIGKKDWEIKQEFLKSNPMSQEEEKLIERYEEIHKILMAECHSDVISNLSRLIISLKIEAYRSGKLAGFEVCEKLGIQIEGLRVEDGFLWIKIPYQKFGESGLSFSIITSSLIEEEKKKL